MKKLLFPAIFGLFFCFTANAQQGMGVGNNNPQEMLDVTGAIKIGTDLTNTTGAPTGGAGTVRFRAGVFQGWDGSQWVDLGGGGGADTDWTVSGNNQYSAVSGNVGIGTTTPNFKLDVNGSARFSNGSFVNNGLAANPSISFSSDSNTGIYAPSADNLGFVTGGVESFRVDENGNVGIGPVNPDANLDLVGSFRYTDGNQGVNKVLRSDGSGFATWVDPATLISNDGDWTVSGNNQYSAVSGNVGIGTTSPEDKLHLYQASTKARMQIEGTSTGSGDAEIAFHRTGEDAFATISAWRTGPGAGDLRFLTDNGSTHSEKMRILSSGNVGIGNTSPTAKLEVSGQVKITGGTPGANKVLTSDAAGLATWVTPAIGSSLADVDGDTQIQVEESSDEDHIRFDTFGSERMVIDNNGNIGVGTSSPVNLLHIQNDVSGLNFPLFLRNSSISNGDGAGIGFLSEPNGNWTKAGIYYERTGGFGTGKLHFLVDDVADNGTVTLSESRLTIKPNGDVGMGTTDPSRNLDVYEDVNGTVSIRIENPNTGANSVERLSFDNEDGGVAAIALYDNDSGAYPSQMRIFNNRPNGSVHITNTGSPGSNISLIDGGNVGIGTETPIARLDINGTAALNDNQLRLRNGSDANHYLSYIGGSFDGAKLTGNNHVILNTITGGDALIVTGNRVGIGTPSPIAPLHVESQATASYGNFTFYSINQYTGHPNSPTTCCGGTVNGVSIHASGRVMASEFDAFSDARIKNVIGVSNSEEDLKKLLGIEITNYRMKDKAKDVKPYKKVIAQQVEKVYPEAVSTITEVVPDIYALASVENGFVTVEADVELGDKVRLILESGNKMVTVTRVDEAGFMTDSDITEDAFVYGREVDDFRAVDYEAISMLNVSATQQLFKLISELQSDNRELEKQLSEYSSLKSDIELLKEAVGIDLQTAK